MNDCPDGSMTYGSDETALAVAQGLAAMGLIQTTRSGDMDNLEKSTVVGKVGFYSSPSIEEGWSTCFVVCNSWLFNICIYRAGSGSCIPDNV